MIKKIHILGSTGSIGKQTLSVINKNKDKYRVYSLAAGKSIKLLLNQVSKFKPQIICTMNEKDAILLKKNPLLKKMKILHGDEGLKEIGQSNKADILVSATSGVNSLIPTIEFLKLGKRVCVASKEIFLLYGEKINHTAQKYSGEIIPIDSEHSGLFQLIRNENINNMQWEILECEKIKTNYEKFIESIKTKQNMQPDFNQGAKIQKIIDSCIKSNDNNCWVDINS